MRCCAGSRAAAQIILCSSSSSIADEWSPGKPNVMGDKHLRIQFRTSLEELAAAEAATQEAAFTVAAASAAQPDTQDWDRLWNPSVFGLQLREIVARFRSEENRIVEEEEE